MDNHEFERCLHEYVALQRELVVSLLERVRPRDSERFRDVADGTLVLGRDSWSYWRHGAGITFESGTGVRVNAHKAMVEYPMGFDSGRLTEYLTSIGVESFCFQGKNHPVSMASIDVALAEMIKSGVVRVRETSGRIPSQIFELVASTA